MLPKYIINNLAKQYNTAPSYVLITNSMVYVVIGDNKTQYFKHDAINWNDTINKHAIYENGNNVLSCSSLIFIAVL